MLAATRSQVAYSCTSQACISASVVMSKSTGLITSFLGKCAIRQARQFHPTLKHRPSGNLVTSRGFHRSSHHNSHNTSLNNKEDAQQRAYAFYKRQKTVSSSASQDIMHQRNVRIAMYATAVVIGALGATYASVPLYKIFCQMTGFGGTTQRVRLFDEDMEEKKQVDGEGNTDSKQALWEKLVAFSNIPLDMLPKSITSSSSSSSILNGTNLRRGSSHVNTWTDEDAVARLASLRPVANGRLITVRFDSTVGDVLPWSFRPTQLDVKVVPGETALSFFTATNHSNKPITGVATYNVHPPRAGLYFNKIQCFCFEEQRLLPGETVDMPVFFFIDPDFIQDPQLSRVNHVTLSYTFFQTDVEDEEVVVEEHQPLVQVKTVS